MRLEEILDIVQEFENSSLTTLKLEMGDLKLQLEKGVDGQVYAPLSEEPLTVPTPAQPKSTPAAEEVSVEEEKEEVVEGFMVESPIVATFYRSPSPDSDPFVKIGDEVEEGDVLFILEAMKMFNEIKSPVSGRVINIFPKDGDMVEFGERVVEIEVENV